MDSVSSLCPRAAHDECTSGTAFVHCPNCESDNLSESGDGSYLEAGQCRPMSWGSRPATPWTSLINCMALKPMQLLQIEMFGGSLVFVSCNVFRDGTGYWKLFTNLVAVSRKINKTVFDLRASAFVACLRNYLPRWYTVGQKARRAVLPHETCTWVFCPSQWAFCPKQEAKRPFL